MNKEKIWLSSPHMGGREQDFVKEAFDTNWIAPLGPNVDGFEQDLQNYADVGYAAVLTSGTAAIHLALIVLGIEEGDEVLVSSFTFSGSINPIIYQKAIPIMVDSEKDTWNMSPHYLEEAILDRIKKKGEAPKAVILVHLYGMPAKLNELLDICRKYEVKVIEDAAEALGSSYEGRKLGSFGDIGIFSFNGNKIITTSGGGALLSNNEDWVDKARFLSTQARDTGVHYEHSEIGYNYRMSNIVAGVGRGQMTVIDKWINIRRAHHAFYSNLFKSKKGIEVLKEPDERFFSNFWLTTIIVNDQLSTLSREGLRLALLKENIESRPLWKPMHMQPAFKDFPYYGDHFSNYLFEKGLCLPSGSNMTDDDLIRIEEAITSTFEKA